MQLCKRIGEKLKAIRLKRNITQQSLAEAASISLSSVKKVENGEIGSFDTLLRILRMLGMLEAISSLFEEEQLSPNECDDGPAEVLLQMKLTKEKKDQVLKLVFGENNIEILNK